MLEKLFTAMEDFERAFSDRCISLDIEPNILTLNIWIMETNELEESIPCKNVEEVFAIIGEKLSL